MLRITDLNANFIPLVKFTRGAKISFDYEPFYNIDEDGNSIKSNIGTWTEIIIRKEISLEQIKTLILEEINKTTQDTILNSFQWRERIVRLTLENQLTYKMYYDLAVQTNGKNLPITVKFGDKENPIYYTFEEIPDLEDFYISLSKHINKCLSEG